MNEIAIKRVYEDARPEDGYRVLIDRIWPRGLSREKVSADLWLKDAAPSHELRRAFHHEGIPWDTFKSRYTAELASHPQVVQPLLDLAEKGKVTLLYSAHDSEQNQAVVLREFLMDVISGKTNRQP